jgi:hypothetical protein
MAEGGRSGDQGAEGGDPDGDPSLTEGVVDAGCKATLPLGDRAHRDAARAGLRSPVPKQTAAPIVAP